MTPQRILKDVREVFPEDGIICTDVGWNKNGVGQQFDITVSGTIIHPGGFGTNASVLAAAKEYNIPVVWVVMNNFAFGTIAGLEGAHYNHNFGTVFKLEDKPYNPEWAYIAKAYGIKAKKVTSAEELIKDLPKGQIKNQSKK